jgi:hypothetical protein
MYECILNCHLAYLDLYFKIKFYYIFNENFYLSYLCSNFNTKTTINLEKNMVQLKEQIFLKKAN